RERLVKNSVPEIVTIQGATVLVAEDPLRNTAPALPQGFSLAASEKRLGPPRGCLLSLPAASPRNENQSPAFPFPLATGIRHAITDPKQHWKDTSCARWIGRGIPGNEGWTGLALRFFSGRLGTRACLSEHRAQRAPRPTYEVHGTTKLRCQKLNVLFGQRAFRPDAIRKSLACASSFEDLARHLVSSCACISASHAARLQTLLPLRPARAGIGGGTGSGFVPLSRQGVQVGPSIIEPHPDGRFAVVADSET